jgi:hypothetical protein
MIGHVVAGPDTGDQVGAERIGRVAFGFAVMAFVIAGAPVVWRSAPLGDDFNNCLMPLERGLGSFLAQSWDRLGMMRLARFVEILVTTGVCRSLPFGVAIVVPLVLTLAVAWLVRGLLRDLHTPAPWSDIGASLWLLQPLGTEAGLWPASLHVPLGLACAVGALRLVLHRRYAWAALAAAIAFLSVEQTVLALPFAAWLVAPARRRPAAVGTMVIVSLTAVIAFALWSGSDPRLRVSAAQHLAALVNDPMFYAGFPAVGLGVHSIPLAVRWALPWSVLALATGAVVGALAARKLPGGNSVGRNVVVRWAAAVAVLLALTNAPVLLNVPHQGSPRIFGPTWLVLAVAVAAFCSRGHVRRPMLLGAAGGAFAAGAVLSMALSVSVRLATADFNERSAHLVAARISDGATVAVCGVRRTVTTPAPRGAFAVHEFAYDWSAARTLRYYTGRRATFQLAGELWPERQCPAATQVGLLVSFDDLLAGAGHDGY